MTTKHELVITGNEQYIAHLFAEFSKTHPTLKRRMKIREANHAGP